MTRKSSKVLEDVQIIFPDFRGSRGKPCFSIALDMETAQKLTSEGWNVKYPKPDDSGFEREPYLNVNIRYTPYSKIKAVSIVNGHPTEYDEDTIGSLGAFNYRNGDVENVDIVINPYEFKPGTYSAYLKTIYVTLADDPLYDKHGC